MATTTNHPPAQIHVQSIDPEVEKSSQWEIAPNGQDLVRKEGNIGINTVPTATLDVNGKIKTKKLHISDWNGFLVARRGEIIPSEVQMSDISGIQVNEIPTDQLQFLVFKNDAWYYMPSNEIHHSKLDDLDKDDHIQYLNVFRHGDDAHHISALNVKNALVVDNNVQVNVPLIVNDVIFKKEVAIDNLRLGKISGILYAKNGKVSAGITTTDIPEGINQYFTGERVLAVTQNTYLSLDGSNLKQCTGLQQFVQGLDADKLDGKNAEDFAANVHEHNHADLVNLSVDDHHPKNHNITDHIVTGQMGQILKITADNVAALAVLSADDLPNNIPLGKIGNGSILESDMSKLAGANPNIQEQLNQKTDMGHSHQSADLLDIKEDIQKQYLNPERADVWLASKTTDDIFEGDKKFYSDDKVIKVADNNYWKLDGTNIGIKKLPLDVEKLNGLSSSDFASSKHAHSHKALSDIAADDHHSESHPFLGETHDVGKLISRTFLTVDHKGKPVFQGIDIRDLPNQIPADSIAGGQVKNSAFEALANVSRDIQGQLDGKAILNHSHAHSTIIERDKDDHVQYFNQERLGNWLSEQTSDNIGQGSNNLYVNTVNVFKALTLASPLIKTETGLGLQTDGNFIVDSGALSLCQNIDTQASVEFASAKIGQIVSNKIDVNGSITASGLTLVCQDGILHVENGVVKSHAEISQLMDIDVSNPKNNQVLTYQDGKWINQDMVVSVPMVQEVKQEKVQEVVVETPVNFYVAKAVGIGVKEPRAGLDVGTNKIIAGPDKKSNVLELSDNANDIVFTTANKSKMKFSSNDNYTSLAINSYQGIARIISNTLELQIKASRLILGKKNALTIIENGYVGVGITAPLFPVDIRGVVGISNDGQPSNWLMFRTDIETQNPLIAFPYSKQLMIGTYDGYSTRGIWRNIVSIGGDGTILLGNAQQLVKVVINGEIVNKISRYEVTEQINDLVINSNIVKFTQSEAEFVITGIANGVDGKMITLINGTDFDMIIQSDEASAAANRFDGDVIVASKSNVSVLYDKDINKWIILK